MALFKEKWSLQKLVMVTVAKLIIDARFETEHPNLEFLKFAVTDPSGVLSSREREEIELEVPPLIMVFTFLELVALVQDGKAKASPDDLREMFGNALYTGFREVLASDSEAEAGAMKYIDVRQEYVDAVRELGDERVQERGYAFGFCEVFVERILGAVNAQSSEYREKHIVVFQIAVGTYKNTQDAMQLLTSKVKVV